MKIDDASIDDTSCNNKATDKTSPVTKNDSRSHTTTTTDIHTFAARGDDDDDANLHNNNSFSEKKSLSTTIQSSQIMNDRNLFAKFSKRELPSDDGGDGGSFISSRSSSMVGSRLLLPSTGDDKALLSSNQTLQRIRGKKEENSKIKGNIIESISRNDDDNEDTQTLLSADKALFSRWALGETEPQHAGESIITPNYTISKNDDDDDTSCNNNNNNNKAARTNTTTPLLLTGSIQQQSPGTLRCIIISDTHLEHDQVSIPEGDILIHLGDVTNKGSLQGVQSFAKWFSQHPHRHKIIIDGNHDRDFLHPEKISLIKEYGNIAVFLQDEVINIEGLQILGLTWNTCMQQDYGRIVRYLRSSNTRAVHLLLTHMPPTMNKMHGSKGLITLASKLHVKVHLFGHFHWARGVIGFGDDKTNDSNNNNGTKNDGVVRINCSTLPALMPVVIDLDSQTGELDMVYLPSPGENTKYQQESYYRSQCPSS